MREECDVTSDLYAKLITRACSTASGAARAISPSVPAPSAKQMHERFGVTATNADVWPLSPQDWSTG